MVSRANYLSRPTYLTLFLPKCHCSSCDVESKSILTTIHQKGWIPTNIIYIEKSNCYQKTSSFEEIRTTKTVSYPVNNPA